jgi:uncharacterized RDD family membrane protein YckC
VIEDYLREFDSHLVGTEAEKAEWRAELLSHLDRAREAGDLEGAIARFGSPREAAASFRSGRPIVPAGLRRRWEAMVIDHVPLLIVSAVVLAQEIAQGHGVFFSLPPVLVISDRYPASQNIGVPLALLWSYVGLALLESRSGRTPGKALLGLRAVSADGTAITRKQAFERRWSILAGPLVVIDWLFARHTERSQRLLDLLAGTMVVDDPQRAGASAPVTEVSPLGSS